MTHDGFDRLVQASVAQALSDLLGAEVWKAISFYFDVKTLASDPEAFGKVLDKLFGGTSKVLKQIIGKTLVANVNGQADDRRDREFPEWIQIAKAKFLSSSALSVRAA